MLNRADILLSSLMEEEKGIDHYPHGVNLKWKKSAADKLRTFALQGHGGACYYLCRHVSDPIESGAWAIKAADLGNVTAMKLMFIRYINGRGGYKKNIDLAIKYLASYQKHVDFLKTTNGLQGLIFASAYELFTEHRRIEYADKLQEALCVTVQLESLHAAHSDYGIPSNFLLPKTPAEKQFLSDVTRGNEDGVRAYLQNNGNPLIRVSVHGETALHLAVMNDHLAILELLINAYKSLDYYLDVKATERLVSPIVYAMMHDRPKHVALLLKSGADPRSMGVEAWPRSAFEYSNSENAKAELKAFMNHHQETIQIDVIPLLGSDDKALTVVNYGDEVNNVRPAYKNTYFAHVITMKSSVRIEPVNDEPMLNDIYRYRLQFKISHLSGFYDESECQLQISIEKPGNFERDDIKLHRGYITCFGLELNDYLKSNNLENIPFSSFGSGSLYSGVIISFPYAYLPKLFEFIFSFHQDHRVTITASRPLNQLSMLAGAPINMINRLSKMTSIYHPTAAHPDTVLADPLALKIMKSRLGAGELARYRSYAEIRKWAYFFAVAAEMGRINLDVSFLIRIAAMTGDFAIHSERDSLQIASRHFKRPLLFSFFDIRAHEVRENTSAWTLKASLRK